MALLIGDILNLDNIDNYKLDGFVFSYKLFSTEIKKRYNYNEIKKIVAYCLKNGKKSIINVDKIFEEEELESLQSFLEKCLTLNIDYYIYSDFAVLSFFKNKGLEDHLIYNPKTLITSFAEASFYNDKNELVIISNELSLAEIKNIVKSKNTIIEAFGYHQMFYSRRELLKKYQLFSHLNEKLTKRTLFLKEELRDNLYRIHESNDGVFIYTDYIYFLFEDLPFLKDDLQMIKLNSEFIKEEDYIKAINNYRLVLEDDSKIDVLRKDMENTFDNLSRGFLDKKSILLKENSDE